LYLHEDQEIKRVAVTADGMGNEAEFERKNHPGGHGAAERKKAALLVLLEFVLTTLRRVNDRIDVVRSRLERGKACEP
jgi:hypothetical protein